MEKTPQSFREWQKWKHQQRVADAQSVRVSEISNSDLCVAAGIPPEKLVMELPSLPAALADYEQTVV